MVQVEQEERCNVKCGIMDEVSESSFVARCSVVSLVVGSGLNVVMGFSRRFLDFRFHMLHQSTSHRYDWALLMSLKYSAVASFVMPVLKGSCLSG